MATRTDRRRERTRAQLLDAARVRFARHGVEATRINEITEEADVGFGSFYNHFTSKEDIVAAVVRETVEVQGSAVDALTRDLDDPAEVVSVAHRYFVRLARTDPVWGWLLVNLDVTNDVMRDALGPRALRDLRAGVKAGRFEVDDVRVALNAGGGALLAVMRAVLKDELSGPVDSRHAEGMLRLLGVEAGEAARIARLPVPGGTS
jgi:AcrR family transcriptional regulator